MPAPDLTDDDYTDLAALVRAAMDAEPYRVGPRMSKLKRLLAKLEPGTDKPAVFPPNAVRHTESRLFEAERRRRRWRGVTEE